MSLPDIFLNSRDRTPKHWEEALRPEVLSLFERHIYGVTPKEKAEASYQITEASEENGVRREALEARFTRGGKTCGFKSRIYMPAGAKGPLPAVVMLNPFAAEAEAAEDPLREYFPYAYITKRGYAAVLADVGGFCADDKEKYARGLMELYPPEGESGWGAMGAWAWGTSRIADYLLRRPEFDPKGLAVLGCSRGGKAALWCGAQDERFSVVISNVSGCSGAALARGKKGERVERITRVFPHWFCKKYAAYAEREDELPVDQHMLLALAAPRFLYVSSASEDEWADPPAEFAATAAAGPIYGSYGLGALPESVFPPMNTPIVGEKAAYHLREGEHGCKRYDWEKYLDAMDRWFGRQG